MRSTMPRDRPEAFTGSVKTMMLVISIFIAAGAGIRASVPALVGSSGPFAKVILLVLLVVSAYSWAVIWDRLRAFGRVERADRAFLTSFRKLSPQADARLVCEQHPESVLAKVAQAGQRALDLHPSGVGASISMQQEFALRAMDRATGDQTARLERHIGFLATAGSVSPFIGLMGTVWGVMSAFLNIGAQGSASLVVVAPGIAEALIATVAGLAAAIPAVVGYNHLLARLRELGNGAAQFGGEWFDRRMGGSAS
jgi:biopolymer transport protein TolQ